MHSVSEFEKKYARVWGSPGSGARAAGLFRVIWPVLLLLLLIGYFLGVALPPGAMSQTLCGLVLLALAGALAYAVNYSYKRLGRHIKGARGEEITARRLGFLPRGYDIYHSVMLEDSRSFDAGDLDHVVVGPGGLFLIETKNWTRPVQLENGKLVVSGGPPGRSPIEQARTAAARLQRWIRAQAEVAVTVQPVLYFVPQVIEAENGQRKVEDVIVCGGEQLPELLLSTTAEELTEGVLAKVNEVLQELMVGRNV